MSAKSQHAGSRNDGRGRVLRCGPQSFASEAPSAPLLNQLTAQSINVDKPPGTGGKAPLEFLPLPKSVLYWVSDIKWPGYGFSKGD